MQKQTTTSRSSKKTGLGKRGADVFFSEPAVESAPVPGLISDKTISYEEKPAPSQWQLAGETIERVGLVLAETIPAMSEAAREMTLETIIRLCQAEMRGGARR